MGRSDAGGLKYMRIKYLAFSRYTKVIFRTVVSSTVIHIYMRAYNNNSTMFKQFSYIQSVKIRKTQAVSDGLTVACVNNLKNQNFTQKKFYFDKKLKSS